MALNVVSRVYKDFQARELPFLLANSLDPMYVTYTVEPFFGVTFSSTQQVIKEGGSFTLTSGSWEDYGFVAGDTLTSFDLNGSGATATTTITYIDGSYMMTTDDLVASDTNYSIGTFYVDKAPEGFNLLFNLVENANPGNENSIIDGEAQRFTVDGVDALSVSAGLDFVQLGDKSGGSTMAATITRIADVDSRKRYEIQLFFYVWPWVDGSIFAAANCVKPWCKIEALPQFNNPSVKLSTTNVQTANTGWKDENWNGGINNFVATSIDWEDDSTNALTAFDYSQPSNFSIRIDGAFTASSKFNFKMFFPSLDDDDFKNLPTDHNKNTIACVSNSTIDVGVPASLTSATHSSGASYTVNNITVTNNTTYVTITGRIVPNAAFTTLIGSRDESNRLYRIWVRCEDPTKDYNSSDAVNLELEYNTAVLTPTPLGAWADVTTDLIINHELVDVNSYSKFNLFTEDNLIRYGIYNFPNDEQYDAIIFRIWAEKISNGDKFLLEEHEVNLAPFPILSDGTVPINYSVSRGFKLPTDSEGINIVVQRYPSADTVSTYGIEFGYPFLNRWEYWLEQANADNEFWGDKTKDWQHYSADADWRIQSEVAIRTLDGGEYSNTINFEILDYDPVPETTTTITFETLDAVSITAPLSDQIVKVIVTHEPDVMTAGATAIWGEATVEPFEGAPRWLISNLYDQTDANSPLQPLTGYTKIKETVNATSIVHEFLFDPSKIDITNGVSFTARIKCNTV